MATPQLSQDQIAHVSGLLAGYITEQRAKYAPRAVALSTQQRAAVDGFFSPQLLDRTCLLELRGERVADPDFYPMLESMGFNNLPEQRAMAAITFSDVVVSHGHLSAGTLFHELVHVEQYRQLGVARFAELYVRGLLSGGEYAAIPLEIKACTLGERYEQDPGRPFSVADEVKTWIREGRF